MSDVLILGIETSCDDTSLCILKKGSTTEILAFESFSQELILKEWGGIVPEIASRYHNEKIVPLLEVVLKKANIKLEQINVIAVTTLPGLLGPLLTGLNVAKSLALYLEIPIYPVNHLKAHLEAIHLTEKVAYPYLGMLVSGGHSLFSIVYSPTNFDVLGSTTDDAAGEAFDKGGKLLGLGYPGGKLIDDLAKKGNEKAYPFPIGLPQSQDANLSYSGLKTALRNFIDKHIEIKNNPPTQLLYDVCASYQKAIIDALLLKCTFAVKLAMDKTGQKQLPLVIGGGVACNSFLRKRFQESYPAVHFVAPMYCTDNGAMVANLGCLDLEQAIPFPECLKLDAESRWIDKKEFLA
ncbi:MAG: tRNA (adenosine(37)-N6)-threonylcarbamoyltransferase complex transferase subunit TsaD [Bacteriovoracaceae bacterium]